MKGCIFIYIIPICTVGTGIINNSYSLTRSLLALETTAPVYPSSPLPHTVGFMPLQEWDQYLVSHPDQIFAAFMRRGMTSGFRIGVDRSRPLHLAQGNLQSASSHSHIVSDYISREVQNHRLRMVPLSQAPLVRCNPIGLIPKQNQPGKFRLIVNLSAPIGHMHYYESDY